MPTARSGSAPSIYYRKEQGAKAKFRFRARVNLPNLGPQVSVLIAGADEDEDGFDDSVQMIRPTDGMHRPAVFHEKSHAKWNTSFTAGV